MNTIGTHNQEILVEEIMERIRATIKERKGETPVAMEMIRGDEGSDHPVHGGSFSESLDKEFYFLANNSNIQNNSYFISSHHPYIGKLLVQGRQLVHGEVKRYVDPIIFRQTGFNENNLKILKKLAEIISLTEQRVSQHEKALPQIERDWATQIEKTGSDLVTRIQESQEYFSQIALELRTENREGLDSLARIHQEQLSELRQEMRDEYLAGFGSLTRKQEYLGELVKEIDRKIIGSVDERVQAVLTLMNNDINNKAWLAGLLEKRATIDPYSGVTPNAKDMGKPAFNYFIFEEQFRGSRDSIKVKQTMFIPSFANCTNVLDIGSGRGEFLELLKDNGIEGRGIDIDPNMIEYCRSRNLDVIQADAIGYLEGLEDKSLDGIFIGQLVEHLEPDYLARMLAVCYRKLKFGFHIVIETINPLSFLSFVNFYLDPTHMKPLHPETLKFLLESVRFREIQTTFSSWVPDEAKLRKFDMIPGLEGDERRRIETYNYNVDMLNHVLWGPMDYSVTAKK